MSVTQEEIASQPAMWRRAVELRAQVATQLPSNGERVALIGCGTSWFVAQSVAAAREAGGHGETDAFTASEMPAGRAYDRVVAISRSGTTTEVARCLRGLPPGTRSLAICAVPETPVVKAADDAIVLDFADERSIVQTRSATTVLALFRAHFGETLDRPVAELEEALVQPLPVDPSGFEHFVILGHGWTVGLAAESALKLREAGQAWSESYPAMEYRHGPISVAGPATVVWMLGVQNPELVRDVRATGATVVESQIDPMAELVTLQRLAVALGEAKGLDPDQPQHLTRSVVLG